MLWLTDPPNVRIITFLLVHKLDHQVDMDHQVGMEATPLLAQATPANRRMATPRIRRSQSLHRRRAIPNPVAMVATTHPRSMGLLQATHPIAIPLTMGARRVGRVQVDHLVPRREARRACRPQGRRIQRRGKSIALLMALLIGTTHRQARRSGRSLTNSFAVILQTIAPPPHPIKIPSPSLPPPPPAPSILRLL